MGALIKHYLFMSKRSLTIACFFIIFNCTITYFYMDVINLAILLFILIEPFYNASTRFLHDGLFIKQLRTMPITSKVLVKSIYLYLICIILLLFVPIILFQYSLLDSGRIDLLDFKFTFCILAIYIATIATTLKKYFITPADKVKTFTFGIMIAYLFVFYALHYIFTMFWSRNHAFTIGLLIVPTISCIIYYNQHKKAIIAFEKAEF